MHASRAFTPGSRPVPDARGGGGIGANRGAGRGAAARGDRGHARQRATRAGAGRPAQPDRRGAGLLPGGLAQRAARGDRAGPLPRAHDVQGHAHLRPRADRAPHRGKRRPGQRLHHQGRDQLLHEHRGGQARSGAPHRGGPDAAPAAGRRRDRLRAAGRDGRAPDALGGRPGRARLRGDELARVQGASLSLAHHRVDVGYRPHQPGRAAGVLRHLLPAQQRDFGDRGRRATGRRAGDGAPSLRGSPPRARAAAGDRDRAARDRRAPAGRAARAGPAPARQHRLARAEPHLARRPRARAALGEA